MSIQPDLRLFASPWSPPTWMKQPCVYNYGVLRWEPEILEAYALYLLRFVQKYQFVAPSSVRRDLQGPWSGNALAFQTPDHSTVVVSANPFKEPVEVVMTKMILLQQC